MCRRPIAPIFAVLMLAGCAIPGEIALLKAPPTVPYGTIQTFTIHQPYVGDLHDDILDSVQRRGADLGADAVVIKERHIDRGVDHLDGLKAAPEEFVTGIAIRYEKGRNGFASAGTPTTEARPVPPPTTFTPAETLAASSVSGGSTSEVLEEKHDTPTLLAPFMVNARPVQAFGFGVRIIRDTATHQVEQITVDQVVPESAAAQAGLGPLTSIRKINGRPVQDYIGSLSKGSELFGLLMNRKSGDQITLEVLDLGSTAPRVVTLTNQPLNLKRPNDGSFHLSIGTSTSDRLSPDGGRGP